MHIKLFNAAEVFQFWRAFNSFNIFGQVSTVITLNSIHVCAEVSDACGKMSYCSDSRRGSQARECEISTDLDPQDMF